MSDVVSGFSANNVLVTKVLGKSSYDKVRAVADHIDGLNFLAEKLSKPESELYQIAPMLIKIALERENLFNMLNGEGEVIVNTIDPETGELVESTVKGMKYYLNEMSEIKKDMEEEADRKAAVCGLELWKVNMAAIGMSFDFVEEEN